MKNDVEWEPLRLAAVAALARAYAPYSGFAVGAGALLENGEVVSGCNVENASYGLTLCAECAVVTAARMSGGGLIRALYCVDAAGAPLMPCGRCRQLLFEFASPGFVLMSGRGPLSMEQLLPDAFGPATLEGS